MAKSVSLQKAPPKRRRSVKSRWFGALLAGTALLIVLGVAWRLRQPVLIAERLERLLAEDSESDVELHLRQLAALGDAGVGPLVEALASKRECIREAARPLLIETVDRWELLPGDAATGKLTILARSLAAVTPRLEANNRRFAAELAMRILHWPREEKARGQESLLANCESILATVAAKRDAKQIGDLATAQSASAASQPPTGGTAEQRAAWTMLEMSRLPGGGLPIELASIPPAGAAGAVATDTIATKQGDPSLDANEPRRLSGPIEGHPLSEADGQANRALGPNQPGRLPAADEQGHDGLANHPDGQQLTAEMGTRPGANYGESDNRTGVHQASLRELVRRLHVSDTRVSSEAATELARRGISGSLLELARQAGDPNPQIRRQLAEQLPQLLGVDARPWLLELSYDEDPRVRVTAVTLMATSGDIELLKRVQQVSRDDPDDQTRAQAQKALPDYRRR